MMPTTAPTTATSLLRTAACSFLGVSAVVFASPAFGGSTLVSRESGLRASGASAAGEYDLSNGSLDFDVFDDNLLSDDTSARSMARQHSLPRLGAESNAFHGATADGAARAAVDASAADAFSSAESDFDLVFRVDGDPARVRLEYSIDASGDATTGVRLYDVETLEPAVLHEVSGDSREYNGEQVLRPGVYGLSVWAFVRGTPQDSAASYRVDVSLAAGGEGPPPVTPMPLPSGAWAGLATMVAGGAWMRVRRRAR